MGLFWNIIMAATQKNNIVYAFINGQIVPKAEAVLPANDLGLDRKSVV
jgi:hypothetical protein